VNVSPKPVKACTAKIILFPQSPRQYLETRAGIAFVLFKTTNKDYLKVPAGFDLPNFVERN